jgi:hypothetical protein
MPSNSKGKKKWLGKPEQCVTEKYTKQNNRLSPLPYKDTQVFTLFTR